MPNGVFFNKPVFPAEGDGDKSPDFRSFPPDALLDAPTPDSTQLKKALPEMPAVLHLA